MEAGRKYSNRRGHRNNLLNLDKKQVDLGISAPDDVAINREEVYKKKQR